MSNCQLSTFAATVGFDKGIFSAADRQQVLLVFSYNMIEVAAYFTSGYLQTINLYSYQYK